MKILDLDRLSEHSGIKKKVLEEIIGYAREYNLERLVLFGSRARGDFARTSDIDLYVYGEESVWFADAVHEETSTLLCFDIVFDKRNYSTELHEVIQDEGIQFFEQEKG